MPLIFPTMQRYQSSSRHRLSSWSKLLRKYSAIGISFPQLHRCCIFATRPLSTEQQPAAGWYHVDNAWTTCVRIAGHKPVSLLGCQLSKSKMSTQTLTVHEGLWGFIYYFCAIMPATVSAKTWTEIRRRDFERRSRRFWRCRPFCSDTVPSVTCTPSRMFLQAAPSTNSGAR